MQEKSKCRPDAGLVQQKVRVAKLIRETTVTTVEKKDITPTAVLAKKKAQNVSDVIILAIFRSIVHRKSKTPTFAVL